MSNCLGHSLMHEEKKSINASYFYYYELCDAQHHTSNKCQCPELTQVCKQGLVLGFRQHQRFLLFNCRLLWFKCMVLLPDISPRPQKRPH